MSGAELKARRKALGLTQQALADRAGVTKRSLANWEGGPEQLTYGRKMMKVIEMHLEKLLSTLEQAQKKSSHTP